MSDWIDEPAKHRKKKTRKPYKIEFTAVSFYGAGKWMTWNKYRTVKDRDTAIDNLSGKYQGCFEFRIPTQEIK